MPTKVQVPALGESITEGTLAEWLKQPGDTVAQDEPIASLETDKVSVEVPSPVAGVLSEQLVKAGRHGRGRRRNCGDRRWWPRRSSGAAAPARAREAAADAAEATANPKGAGENVALRSEPAPASVETPAPISWQQRRLGDHHVARGAPRGARISCRSDAHQRQWQGRPADQGRRHRRGPGAESRFPGAGRGPGAGSESTGHARNTAFGSWTSSCDEEQDGRARQDVADAADHRQAIEGCAEHRRAADHLQRCRHVGGDRRPRPLQGSVRKEARHPPGLHGLFRESGGARRARRALGQRQHRRRRDRLSRLSRRLGRGVGAQGPGRPGCPQRRRDELRRDRKSDRRVRQEGQGRHS